MAKPKTPWPDDTEAQLNEDTTANNSKEPENFSWVEKDVLAAMAYPGKKGNLEFLRKNAIAVLINYQNIPKVKQKDYDDREINKAESIQYVADPKNYGIKVYCLYIKDWTAPSFEQIIRMNEIIDKAKDSGVRVGMHCWGGFGRTGTMVAGYLIYNGKDTEEAKTSSFVDVIITETRKIRDGSIEIATQEEVLHTYWYYLQEVKKGNKDALGKTRDLATHKKDMLRKLQPDVKLEEHYDEENCKKARQYALGEVK